jgi:hypothetical protein
LLAELFIDEAVEQGLEGFAGLGEYEIVGWGRPIELEAGGEGRDPDLAGRGVGRNDEFAGWIVEADVEGAGVVFHVEIGFALGLVKAALQGFQGRFDEAAEFLVVHLEDYKVRVTSFV